MRPRARNLTLPPSREGAFSSREVWEVSSPKLKIKRILVPIDFSAPSLKALEYAVPLAEQFGATLCLVHVVEPASFVHGLSNVPLAMTDEAAASRAKAKLILLARKETEPLIPVKPQVRIGKPFHEI